MSARIFQTQVGSLFPNIHVNWKKHPKHEVSCSSFDALLPGFFFLLPFVLISQNTTLRLYEDTKTDAVKVKTASHVRN